MAISFFGSEEKGIGDNVKSHHRIRKFPEGFLITNDYGAWAFLSKDEYRKYVKNEADEDLFNVLKEKNLVINKNNIPGYIKEYREKCQYLFQGTSLHIIVVTQRCNIRCKYCHSCAKSEASEGYDLDEETAKKAVDLIFQSPSKPITIEFQGGEPLLNFKIIKFIVKYAKKKNDIYKKDLRFSLVTNLILMDEEKLNFLIKEKIGICTSLDGPQIVHDKNRQGYEETVKWIKAIKERYHLNAMMLVTKNSLGHEKEIVDEYVRLGFSHIWIKPVNYLGYASSLWEEIGVSSTEFLDFYKNAMEHILSLNNKGVLIIESYMMIILRKILTKECVNFTDLESPCGAGIGQLAYNFDGSIYTCDEGRRFELFKLGTVDDKYKDLLCSSGCKTIVTASINDNPACEVCAYKPYCGVCPVCSYAETGNIISKLPNRRCRTLIGMFDYAFENILDDDNRKTFLDWLDYQRRLESKPVKAD